MNFRQGNQGDLIKLKELGIISWWQFKEDLTEDNWNSLYKTISSLKTYSKLLENSECFVCEAENGKIMGMAFLVPSGNADDIYQADWCRLRFVSVHPDSRGKRIGEKLTSICMEKAIRNNEQIMALHTSEIMSTARYIYEKLGFNILKEIEPRLGVKYWLYTIELRNFINN